jgi:ABC-2 type transport system permease protein
LTFPFDLPRFGVVGALVRRDYLVTRSYRLAFALDIFYGALGLATYYFISRTFGTPPKSDLSGAPSYFAFAAVGLALGMVVEAATAGLGRRLREEQLTGTLEALAAHPLTSLEMCLGLVGFPYVFAMSRAISYLIVAGLWAHLDVSATSWPGVVGMLAISGIALFGIGILAAAMTLVFKRGEVLAGMIVFGITLLSGAVFPISSLPGWLQPLGKVLPLRFAFDGVRSALFTGESWEDDFLVLLAYALVGVPIAVAAFKRSLAFVKRQGSLAQY